MSVENDTKTQNTNATQIPEYLEIASDSPAYIIRLTSTLNKLKSLFVTYVLHQKLLVIAFGVGAVVLGYSYAYFIPGVPVPQEGTYSSAVVVSGSNNVFSDLANSNTSAGSGEFLTDGSYVRSAPNGNQTLKQVQGVVTDVDIQTNTVFLSNAVVKSVLVRDIDIIRVINPTNGENTPGDIADFVVGDNIIYTPTSNVELPKNITIIKTSQPGQE